MIKLSFIICSLLLGIISGKPVENDADYRQFQTSGGSSYSNPALSAGYAVTQGTYSGYPVGYAMPQPAPMNSYMSPFGFQGYGGGFGMPGYSGFPAFFG